MQSITSTDGAPNPVLSTGNNPPAAVNNKTKGFFPGNNIFLPQSITSAGNNPFNVQYLNGPGSNNTSPKLKRCRQRVDAGEPRHIYPGPPKLQQFLSDESFNNHHESANISQNNSPDSNYDGSGLNPFAASASVVIDALNIIQKEQGSFDIGATLTPGSEADQGGKEDNEDGQITDDEIESENDEADAVQHTQHEEIEDFGEKFSKKERESEVQNHNDCIEGPANSSDEASVAEEVQSPTTVVAPSTNGGMGSSSSSSSRRKKFYPIKRKHDFSNEEEDDGSVVMSREERSDVDRGLKIDDEMPAEDKILDECGRVSSDKSTLSEDEPDITTKANSEEPKKQPKTDKGKVVSEDFSVPTSGSESQQANNINNWFTSISAMQNSFRWQEMHKWFYSNSLRQQQQQQAFPFAAPFPFPPQLQQQQMKPADRFGATVSNNSNEKNHAMVAQLQQAQQLEIQQSYTRLAQALKDELLNHLTGTIDKVVSDFSNADQQANAARILTAMSLAIKQQQQQFEQQMALSRGPPSSLSSGNLFNQTKNNDLGQHSGNYTSIFQHNPLMGAAAAGVTGQHDHQSRTTNSNGTGGIFPPLFNGLHKQAQKQPFMPTSINSMPTQLVSTSKNSLSSHDENGVPKKKRSKVTDTVRGPRSSAIPRGESSSYSLPVSERSSPQTSGGCYFPPTMVPQPSIHQHIIQNGIDSPQDSEGLSDYGNDSTDRLTNIHLRKAKLMFFYTRYPNSTLLKSYFPDVSFDKSLTAQLVKWFSNFREFYYMQMEKYAKQALVEGARLSSELHVTVDSEIYKILNQHYNKNNCITPPTKLREVIEQTLRKFFESIQQGRDTDPSWKKVNQGKLRASYQSHLFQMIYKEIQPLDEPIPEFFRNPRFSEILQQVA